MFSIYRGDISIVRGDSALFELNIVDANKNIYTPKEDDTITLTVKKSTCSKEVLFQKQWEDGKFVINPEDTKDLRYGTYVYDVQLVTDSGWVDTIIPPHSFIVMGEVTD